MWPNACFKYWYLGSDDEATRTSAGPSLKFCWPVFMNFSSCRVSFSTFVIVNCNYGEHLNLDKISRGLDFVVDLNFTFGMYSIPQLKVLVRFKKI